MTSLDPRESFFDTVFSLHQNAEQNCGSIVRLYAIGEFTVCLRFAGDALIPLLTPGLDHVEIAAGARPDLTVYLFDMRSTQTIVPHLPWAGNDYSAHGEIKVCSDTRFSMVFFSGMLMLLDRKRNIGVFGATSASLIPYYEKAAPLKIIFNWFFQDKDYHLLHAAAVGTDRGCVLLVGKGGCGKSTAGLACIEAGLLYMGDDYTLVHVSEQPRAYSLYNSAKLASGHCKNFPALERSISNPERPGAEKAVLFLWKKYPQQLASALPVKAILVPVISGLPDTTTATISPGISIKALAPSTLFQLPGPSPLKFQKMSKLVKKVPNYRLDMGTDLRQIPTVILDLLEG